MATLTVYKDLTTKKSNYILYTGKKDLLEIYPGSLEVVVIINGWNMAEEKAGLKIKRTHNWKTYWNKRNLKKHGQTNTGRSKKEN